MRVSSVLVLLTLGVAVPARAEQPWGERMAATVARLEKTFKGRIAVYVADPTLGLRAGHDYETPSYLASGVKVPFMVEVFRQLHAGRLTLDDELVYDESAIRDGAPMLNKRPLGSKLKLREALTLMIKDSDNAASDLIAAKIGIDNVNRGLKELGFDGFTPLTHLIDVRRATLRAVDVAADDLSPTDIRAIRWITGWDSQAAKFCELIGKPPGTYKKAELIAGFDAFYTLGVNSARLDTMASLLTMLATRTLITPELSDQMLDLMTNTHTSKNRILGKLPTGTKVAHKTGSQYERICDLGIIWLPDGHPLVLTACLAGGNDRVAAEATLASIAREAYDMAVEAHKGHKAAQVSARKDNGA